MAESTFPPPYVGYGVLQGTIETLAQTTVPSGPLDRRVLDALSGADHGALMSGMRFLGLVDDERRATQRFRELVAAWKKGREDFQSALAELLGERYVDIRVDLETGTISELEKAFKEMGVPQGQMLTKTIRFYIKALTDAGFDNLSPHITKPKRPTPSPRKANGAGDKPRPKGTKKQAKPEPPKDDVEREDVLQAGFERLPIPGLPGAFVQYPSDLTESHCALFEAMIGVLRTYVKGRGARKEKVS
jgi:hypothetical protein